MGRGKSCPDLRCTFCLAMMHHLIMTLSWLSCGMGEPAPVRRYGVLCAVISTGGHVYCTTVATVSLIWEARCITFAIWSRTHAHTYVITGKPSQGTLPSTCHKYSRCRTSNRYCILMSGYVFRQFRGSSFEGPC